MTVIRDDVARWRAERLIDLIFVIPSLTAKPDHSCRGDFFMHVVRVIPAILSVILLAAHFLRYGNMVLVALTLLSPLLLLIPSRVGVRLLQIVLTLGFLEWIYTSWLLGSMRHAAGVPWTRMIVILGAVAVFTLMSALVLEGVARRRRDESAVVG